MDLERYLEYVKQRQPIEAMSEAHHLMFQMANEAMRITDRLNNAYHTPDEIRALMAELTGRDIDESFAMFPPFYSDFGKNIHIGKNVFINSGCRFQDQGGIYIGDNALIGHCVVMATLNHQLDPERRADLIPAPIVLERNVWIGANATILPGVTIEENSVVAAGAVVTRDVPGNCVVGGVPAKVIRKIEAGKG
jgi:acetyltransferase-like isoleucine patch superfamily enzyme